MYTVVLPRGIQGRHIKQKLIKGTPITHSNQAKAIKARTLKCYYKNPLNTIVVHRMYMFPAFLSVIWLVLSTIGSVQRLT